MGYTAFIFARGGSKGLPGKNVKELAGKPLIAWSIEQALSVPGVERVIVSTDSALIAEVARSHGALTPFIRPETLARDDSPELLAWRHALQYLERTEGRMPPVVLSMPATAPLRSSGDVRRCLDLYESSELDAVLTVTEATSNPYFVMVRLDQEARVSRLMDGSAPLRRQAAPAVFEITSVAFVARAEFVMRHLSLLEGRVKAVPIPAHRAVDIDTELDFEFAEFLLGRDTAGADKLEDTPE